MVICIVAEGGIGSLVGCDLNVSYDRPEQTEDLIFDQKVSSVLVAIVSLNSHKTTDLFFYQHWAFVNNNEEAYVRRF